MKPGETDELGTAALNENEDPRQSYEIDLMENLEFNQTYSPIASCVEIFGLEEEIDAYVWQPLDPDNKSETRRLNLNGHRGTCIEWLLTEQRYMFRTFENVVAHILPENLRLCELEEQHFDMIWPEAWSSDAALQVCHILSAQGFCRLQMFANPEACDGMFDEAEKLSAFRMKQELESAYFGLENKTKLSMLGSDLATDSSFAQWARDIVQFGDALCERSPELGFECQVQTSTYVRSSYKSRGEELHVAPQALEESEDWGQDVAEYVRFMDTRKLCLLHFIENKGGAVWLYPREAKGERSTKITVSPNVLLIFRHDFFDYSYQPIGRNLALQTWFSQGVGLEQPIRKVQLNLKEGYAFANQGVPEPKCPSSHIQSVHANFPGDISSEDHFWTTLVAGVDGVLEWPETRSYDKAIHYSTDMKGAFFQGKSYAKHGGFTNDEQFTQFDNDFFGINADEASKMIPTARWLLETGIQALLKAGHTKQSLWGSPIGTYIGDAGMDWGTLFNRWQYLKPELTPAGAIENTSQSVTTGRLAHIFGFTGPALQFDTACSSSLVALSQAQAFMVGAYDGYSSKSLVMGVNAMWSVHGYLACTSGNMLGPVGRSFSFNQSAEGYTRGELCGAAYVEADSAKQHLCSLVGCVANHDGRSATLTAPSGPAQTELVQKCFRSAGIEEDFLTMSEYHGTGTPLGDPIETGALQAALKKRTTPLVQVCNKASFGHCEPGAGIAGLVKVVLLAKWSIGPPNCHLSELNANIILEGFPGIYDSEVVDSGVSNGFAGVCSFGFAGSNARADVYYEALVSIRKALKLELPPKSLPVAQFAMTGDDDIFIVGSWNAWASVDQMELEEEDDVVHTCYVKLGETRVEYFRLKLGDLLEEEKDFKTFYPMVKNADSSAQVLGPSDQCPEHAWMIDGFADGMPAGTVYKIYFGKMGTQVWWTPVEDDGSIEGEVFGDSYEHKYFLHGSVKKGGFMPLAPGANGAHEVQFAFGPQMREEFVIVRDKDLKQVFHLDECGNLCGPSNMAEIDRKMKFVFHGKTNTVANVSFKIFNGTATLLCNGESFNTL